MFTRYARSFADYSPEIRSNTPLSDEQIQRVAPSIFSETKHDSRSEPCSVVKMSLFSKRQFSF